MDVCCWVMSPSAVMEGACALGKRYRSSCMHIFHLENVCEGTVCCTMCLAQEGETDGESV